ncbi:phosphate ABC transporter substrate-binding protein [Flammeovirga aprica]|uniref:Phosphate-binding protein n=1 Tax=Flammeovirga aprica JL-4 TaxID=694437 RepID=A0A7X9P410_9BACT|nr:phosphate ABC transporter substrate-binding protein [Flammeovirga aprica]NME68489.1 phosphate ABC transporter substrate-binding protein [Flammeovirga aprica JL-4]
MKNLSLKLITVILFNIFVFATRTNGQTNTLRGQGSDTMLPVVEALVNTFSSSGSIDVEGGGSSLGFRGLSDYAVQFALSSRKVKVGEKERIEDQYDHLMEKVIAFDALSIITHSSNPVKKLSVQTIAKIFKGEITNWSEIGGKDIPILVVTRDENSGSFGFFKSEVMGSAPMRKGSVEVQSNSAVVEKVSDEEGAIGYCGIAYVDEVVQPISVSINNKDYVYPSFRNALQKIYPLSRPLYLYYRDSEKSTVQSFVKFALSEKGQQVVAHKGYIPAF